MNLQLDSLFQTTKQAWSNLRAFLVPLALTQSTCDKSNMVSTFFLALPDSAQA